MKLLRRIRPRRKINLEGELSAVPEISDARPRDVIHCNSFITVFLTTLQLSVLYYSVL